MNLPIERIGPAPRSPLAQEHMVPMRDGIRLATDVYLPADTPGPGPTILTRLPYDKTGDYTFMPVVAQYFLRFGYRVVVQDVRGKFRSEGETLLFVNEADDGYDTIDWIVGQPWSDGVVGMWGDSYYGFTQWAAVSSGHRALRAIVPRVTGTRLGQLAEQIPGTHTREVEMAVHRMYPLTFFHDHDIVHWTMDWSRLPYNDSVEKFFDAVGSRSASYDLWYPHPVHLRRFPDGSPFDARPVPVLMTIGWWDNCAPWQWSDHAEIRRRPRWALNEYLLVEAIDHENNSHFEQPWLRESGERTTHELLEMLPRYLDPAVEFFDVFLRDLGRPGDIPRVRWQLANTEPGFRTGEQWPPAGAGSTVLHLAGNALVTTPPAEAATVSWKHDPTDPVPSPAPDAFSYLAYRPDESTLAQRPDVLSFDAAPVDEPLDLVGPVALRVAVRSDGPEADLFARLTDVSPDGSAHLVARGQLTVLAPGYDDEVCIDMGQVGYRLSPGHALRLTVASSDAPEFVPYWGLGSNRWAQSSTAINNQSIVLGGAGGARLELLVSKEPA